MVKLDAEMMLAPGAGMHIQDLDTLPHPTQRLTVEQLVSSGYAGNPEVAERVRQLSELPLLRSLPVEHLVMLAEESQTAHFGPGEAVVRQGEPGDSLYLVVEGRVEVLARVEHDGLSTESAVASLFEGDAVGELSVLDGLPRSATCVAAVPTVCVRLDRDTVLGAMRRDWNLGEALLAVLAQRLRRADALLGEHARDPLTGVNNRRALYELYERESRRSQRSARRSAGRGGQEADDTAIAEEELTPPLAVLFCDVDKFKTVNDTHGHHIGDQVLIAVARAMVELGRATDHVARFGGDEFVLLLPEGGAYGANLVTNRLRDKFKNDPPGPVPFTISIGSAIVDPVNPPSLDELMKQADEEMYRDKQRSR